MLEFRMCSTAVSAYSRRCAAPEPFIGQAAHDAAWTSHKLIETKDAILKDIGFGVHRISNSF